MTAAHAHVHVRARAALIKVQIARKELGLDDDTYRAILFRLTGHRSAGELNEQQLDAVLAEFKAKGWKPKVLAGGRQGAAVQRRSRQADSPAARKARAMWISLHQLGVVRDPSEKALEAMAKRQLGVERMAWMDQGLCYKLIEALKAMAQREGWDQDLSGIKPAHHVRVLKVRLAWAQARRLGEGFSAASMTDASLDAAIAAYAKRIHDPKIRGREGHVIVDEFADLDGKAD